MTKDYRITKYCDEIVNVKEKKEKLQIEILNQHKTNNIYQYISKRDSKEKKEFAYVYNCRCAYCGAKITHLHIDSFEIDHYFGRKPNSFISDSDINKINNLIFSCMRCNSGKSDFTFINKFYANLLFPDDNIQNVFKRNELFKIVINDEYELDKIVLSFYNKLKLGSDIHRVEYLLSRIEGIKSKTKDEIISYKLLEVYTILKSKMSMMSY